MVNYKSKGGVDTMLNKLKSRLEQLQSQKQQIQTILNQAVADINMTNGAIQEVARLIEILEGEQVGNK